MYGQDFGGEGNTAYPSADRPMYVFLDTRLRLSAARVHASRCWSSLTSAWRVACSSVASPMLIARGARATSPATSTGRDRPGRSRSGTARFDRASPRPHLSPDHCGLFRSLFLASRGADPRPSRLGVNQLPGGAIARRQEESPLLGRADSLPAPAARTWSSRIGLVTLRGE